jgi:hypothetical protein
VRSDALRDCFDFTQTREPFAAIPTSQTAAFFLNDQPESVPDSD